MGAIAQRLNGRRILIWGYGREGKSTERYIREHCAPASVDVFEGKKDGFDEEKSPGIVMPEDDPKVTSQTELFLSEFRDQVVGITGTKGKSTTSAMLYEVLRACGRDALLVGNIGQPCLDDADIVTPDTVVVYEMSCHQLEHCHVSPAVGVFLNLFEEHLDHYGTLEAYFRAKSHVASYMRSGDIFYRGCNVPEISTRANVLRVHEDSWITAERVEQELSCCDADLGALSASLAFGDAPARHFRLSIAGLHNQYNAAIVYDIAVRVFACDPERAEQAINAFRGLPHRLEYAGTYDGIAYYDDSISTIPEAAINAVDAVPDTATVLIGGMDRGIDYDILINFIRRRSDLNFILAYASGKRIYEQVKDCPNVYLVEDLEQQVAKAGEITPQGRAVVMSNAAASYGYFKNFEERGDCFKKLIQKS